MQKWEYFVAPLLPHNPGDILNTFGDDGWELVGVVQQQTPQGADAVYQHKRLAVAPAVVVQFHVVEILPEWEQGAPGVLCASGPHAIPVSTALRASS